MTNEHFRKRLIHPTRRRQGLAGLDTAIILIAFVITASVLAYVAVNMGLFVTQKAKAVINNGEEQATTALEVGGSVLYSTNYPTNSKSYWIYFPITPSAGISSVQLAPATTSVAFTAPAENITLSNMYNYTLLTNASEPHMTKIASGGENYFYYASPYAALLDFNNTAAADVFQVHSTASACAAGANNFTFSYGGDNYVGCISKDVAFTFPVSGDPLVGSSTAPAGSTIGVMLLFGPDTGDNVFQYQQVQIEITPNIGASLTLTEYVYQPDGTVTSIG